MQVKTVSVCPTQFLARDVFVTVNRRAIAMMLSVRPSFWDGRATVHSDRGAL